MVALLDVVACGGFCWTMQFPGYVWEDSSKSLLVRAAEGFILPDLAKIFDLCLLILMSYEGQKHISYKNLVVGAVC